MESRPEHEVPEIRRLDLAQTWLELAALGAEDAPWLDPPPEAHVTAAQELLRKLGAIDPYVEISPVDAASLGIVPNSRVLVQSRRGQMAARAFVTHSVQPGQVFVPMHFATTNQLTLASFDRRSRQPSYKACAVRVKPLPEGYSGP